MARIEGSNATQREDHARRLAEDHGASIVVYGVIDRYPTTNQIQIQPEFYVVPESFVDALGMTGSFRFGDRILSSGPLANLLDAEGIMSAHTVALAHLMEGLARTEAHDYGAAQGAFEHSLAVSDWADAEGEVALAEMVGVVS